MSGVVAQESYAITNFALVLQSRETNLVVAGSGSLTLLPASPNDDFARTQLDTRKWRAQFSNGGVFSQNGQGDISTSASNRFSGATLFTRYEFIGDFDVQVSFAAGTGWTSPPEDHSDMADLGIRIEGADYRITRINFAGGGALVLVFSFRAGQVLAQMPSSAAQGILRISRAGTTVRFSCDLGAGWQELCVTDLSSQNATAYVSASSNDTFHGFTTYFDDFQINSGVATFATEAGAALDAHDFSADALLDSLAIDADLPDGTAIGVKLYGKEVAGQRWRLIQQFQFTDTSREAAIHPPAYPGKVKFGLNRPDGVRLCSSRTDRLPLLRGLTVRTRPLGAAPAVQLVEPSVRSVEEWDVYELTLLHTNTYANPFWDVEVTGRFRGPDGQVIETEGFYYDSNVWKIRFAPTQGGAWSFDLRFTSPTGTAMKTGSMTCLAPSASNHGFITVQSNRPLALTYGDGTPFIPLGINGHTPAVGAAFLGIEGEAGPAQVPEMWALLRDKRVNAYRLGMFHQTNAVPIFDWNPLEGSANLLFGSGSLDRYNLSNAKLIDRWLAETKPLGINWCLDLMGIGDWPGLWFSASFWSTNMGGPYTNLDSMYSTVPFAGLELQRKYFHYVANRWSAFRNIFLWEYNNELGARSTPEWCAAVDEVIDQADPYGRPHTVSFWNRDWSRNSPLPASDSIDVTDDHCYPRGGYSEFSVDSLIHAETQERRSLYGKPAFFGEFSGSSELWTPEQCGSWHIYDRLALWGIVTAGGSGLYWMSGAHSDAGHAYNRATLDYLASLDRILSSFRDLSQVNPRDDLVSVSDPTMLRAYCLNGSAERLVYLHCFTDHTNRIVNKELIVILPPERHFAVTWLEPSTGSTVGTQVGDALSSQLRLAIPEFTVDLAAYISFTSSLRIASFSTDGRMTLTGLFTNGLCVIERANTVAGPWNPEMQFQTRNNVAQVQLTPAGAGGFYRAVATELASQPLTGLAR